MNDREHIQIVLDAGDCRTLAQGLRVAAQQMRNECRADMQGRDMPPEVEAQAERLDAIAAQVAAMPGLDCSAEEVMRLLWANDSHRAFDLGPVDWRRAGAALGILADRLRAAEDAENASRLAELAGKASAIGDWCIGLRDIVGRLRETQTG